MKAKAETLKAEMLKSERALGGPGRVGGRLGCNPCREGFRRSTSSVKRVLTGVEKTVQSPMSRVQSLLGAGWRNFNLWEACEP
jgi:hypothetical protein